MILVLVAARFCNKIVSRLEALNFHCMASTTSFWSDFGTALAVCFAGAGLVICLSQQKPEVMCMPQSLLFASLSLRGGNLFQ